MVLPEGCALLLRLECLRDPLGCAKNLIGPRRGPRRCDLARRGPGGGSHLRAGGAARRCSPAFGSEFALGAAAEGLGRFGIAQQLVGEKRITSRFLRSEGTSPSSLQSSKEPTREWLGLPSSPSYSREIVTTTP